MQGAKLMSNRGLLTMIALSTTIFVIAALYWASSVFVPVAFSLFIIALAWPVQTELQRSMPTLSHWHHPP